MTPEHLREVLQQQGLVGPQATLTPLSGGVSSDIWLIEDGRRRLVVKRALQKLRVQQDWFADVSRNQHEQDYIDYVAGFLPSAVPQILYRDPAHGFFAMEYLGPEFANWKALLLAGRAVPEHAERAGRILGTIHRRSWNDPQVRARFATSPQFHQLRVDPYLISTGRRHPRLDAHFQAEAARLEATSLCLVHGDFSPKNILIGPDRMVLLDCEVAWFGDPAFDAAFLLNHFLLKALFLQATCAAFLALAERAWEAYTAALHPAQQAGLEQRVCRLLLMLLLARVDGKSPVEYLTDEGKRAAVRAFVYAQLPAEHAQLAQLLKSWQLHCADSGRDCPGGLPLSGGSESS